MTVFDVYLNDRKRCRAGVGRDGVLTAIVNWVRLTGPAATRARQLRHPIEESRLHVGGLSGKTHKSWLEKNLKPGDRVTIVVDKSRQADPPRHERPKISDSRPPNRPLPQTRLLNVDLDLVSQASLAPLVKALGPSVVALFVGREGRKYGAHLEVEGISNNADAIIGRFVAAVRKLPRAERRLWDRAERREFNVGFQAEYAPHAYAWRLDPRTVRRAASVNAGIGVTLYAPEAGPRRTA